MNINFRDICSNSFTIQLNLDSSVSDACQVLSQKLETQGYQIFLISPNENENYYPNNYSMMKVLKENPDYVLFTKCFKNDEIQTEKEDKSNNFQNNQFSRSKQYYYHYPSLNPINQASYRAKNILKLYFMLRFYNMNHLNHYIYQQYSNALNNVPSDFEDRVNQIAEFVFLIEDIKESLRLSNYDVQKATNMIIFQNSNENNQNRHNSNNISHTSFTRNFSFTGNRFSQFYRSNDQKTYSSEKVETKSFKSIQNKNSEIPQNQPQKKTFESKKSSETRKWNFEKLSQNKNDQFQFKFTYQKSQNETKSSDNQNSQLPPKFSFQQNSKWQSSQKSSVFRQQNQNWNWRNSSQNQQSWGYNKKTTATNINSE